MLLRPSLVRPPTVRRGRAARGALVTSLAAIGLAACADGAPTSPAEPAAAAPAASAAIAAAVGDAVCYTETFEDFARGDLVNALTTGPLNLTVETVAFRTNAASVDGQAQIFDTDHVSTSPNDGTDMEWNGAYARCDGCEGLGNLLIVHRYGSGSVLDNNPGGQLTLTGFPSGEYWIQSFTAVDNDGYEVGFQLHVDGVLVGQSVPTGDGSVQTVVTTAQPMITSEVRFTLGTVAPDAALGSGGIDNITFCTNPAPPPNGGCTRTIGYWKNHESVLATRLPQWLGTPNVGVSDQVTSVSEAVAILGGSDNNGINKLRAQLLAAKLNIQGGASATSIAATIAAADAFLATYDVGDWSELSKEQQQQVLAWKDALDAYNNGRLGPTKCG